MSGPALDWAWGQALAGPLKLVLVRLATEVRSRKDGEWRCWPGQDAMATACGMSSRQVRRHLAELADRGLISIGYRPGDGQGRKTCVYTLASPQLALGLGSPDPVDKRGGKRTPATGSAGGQPDIQGGATGHQRPPISKEEIQRRESPPAPVERQSATAPPAGLLSLSACAWDWAGEGRTVRPDLEADRIGESWRRFGALHHSEQRTADAWRAAWRLWIAREWTNHQGGYTIARGDQPTPGGAQSHRPAELPQAAPLTPESRAAARDHLRLARRRLRGERGE